MQNTIKFMGMYKRDLQERMAGESQIQTRYEL